MTRHARFALAAWLAAVVPAIAAADDPKPADPADPAAPAPAEGAAPVSFMKDVAPILVRNCIGCHNAKKSESKYLMTRFDALAKGGAMGEDVTLEPGDPEASYLVELIRADGQPRMPYKQDALPAEQIALIERWVAEGAKYDGEKPDEDWVALLHRRTPVTIPESYPLPVPITAIAFSPDGAEVVASGYHELNAYKAADGALARRSPGQPERVYDMAYSPDGKLLATAGGDPGQFGVAKLYEVTPEGPKFVRDLAESADSLLAIAFAPDGATVAAAGADRSIRIVKVENGEQVALIEDHADWIFDLAYSPDGKKLASASRDKTAKVFDLEKKEALATFPGHNDVVYAVAFAADGNQVVSGGGDARLRVWAADGEAKQAREIPGFAGAVFRLVLADGGKQVIAAGAEPVVRVFEVAEGKHVRNLEGHKDWVYALAVSPDGATMATGSWDGEVRLWSLADGAPLRTILAAPGLSPTPAPAAGAGG